MSGKNRKPGVHDKHASFLDSTTSECYELDLPPVPAGLLMDGNSIRYQTSPKRLPVKAQSPVYTNVNRTLSLGIEEATSPSDQLSTIAEAEDRSSSDGDGSISSDDREDVSRINSHPVTQADSNGETKGVGTRESQAYAKLYKSTIEDQSIYEIPTKEGSIVDGTHSGTEYLRASPELADHQTEYTRMGKTSSTSEILGGKVKQKSWVTFRRTIGHRYMHMKMVGMKKCCSGSHGGAKKFFTFLAVLLFILLTAVMGVVIGISSWIVMQDRADSIEGDLDTYTTSLRNCRVGRNWRSVKLNRSLALDYTVLTDSETLDVPLNNLTQITMIGDISSLEADQLLLYVVLRTSSADGNTSNNVDMMDFPSYINVALWTQTPNKTLFRQYMSILNNLQTPQLVSRSFWFPLDGTDNHFYMSAELIDSNDAQETAMLDFRVQLAGYC